MPEYPALADVEQHIRQVRDALRNAGVPSKVLAAIATRALRTGRKITGKHATNREPRWQIPPDHPQYGTEHDCKIILVKLCAQIYCFDNAPTIPAALKETMEERYLGHSIAPGTYRDRLLLESFNFADLVTEGLSPVHGHSSFHIGHEDPTQQPKHRPDNIGWRTYRVAREERGLSAI